MPIALFHHNKLTLATARWSGHNVLIHSPRIAREARITKNAKEEEIVWVYFTVVERRLELVIHRDEVWQFHKGVFSIIHRQIRNGRVMKEGRQVVPPLLNTFWTQNNDQAWVEDKLNQEQTAQCIVEQYLYENVPDPHAYRVTSFDFARKNADVNERHRSLYQTHNVRPLPVVLEAARNDRSESAEKWLELFEVAQ